MKNLTRGILFLIIALALVPSLQAASYAAIAYSPSAHGGVMGMDIRAKPRRLLARALSAAALVPRTSWAKNAWIALAVSDSSRGGYGMGWATTAAGARSRALARMPQDLIQTRAVVVCVSAYR